MTVFCGVAFLMVINLMTGCRKELPVESPATPTPKQKCSCRPMPQVDTTHASTLDPGT